jgi:hypothetical protein
MSEVARRLFQGLKDGVQAGLGIVGPVLERAGSEIGAEAKRLGTQGGMESASALFSGQSNAFVPYGPGQYTPNSDQQKQHEHNHDR